MAPKVPLVFQFLSPIIRTSLNSRPVRYLAAVVRLLRLQAIQQSTAWREPAERKKTAIYHNRKIAGLHSLIHIVPLGASLALISMTLRKVSVNENASIASTALQFAAKLLEIFIQASIASIVLAFMRESAIGPEPIPFGGLIGAFRIADVSYLWSLDFWGMVSSSTPYRRRKALHILILLSSVSLAALVGPSCAVLMIPRLVTGPEIALLLFLDQSSEVYPTSIGVSTTDSDSQFEVNVNTTFPHLSHGRLSMKRASRVQMTDKSGARTLQLETDYSSSYLLTTPTQISTYGASIMAGGLSGDGNIVIETLQPYLNVSCWADNTALDTNDTSTAFVNFGPTKATLNKIVMVECFLPDTARPVDDSFATWYTEVPGPNTSYITSLVWHVLPEHAETHSVLFAVANSIAPYTSWSVQSACSVDAYWAMAPSVLVSNDGNGALTNQDVDATLSGTGERHLISISPSWASALYDIAQYSSWLLSDATTAMYSVVLGLSNLPQYDESFFDDIPNNNDFFFSRHSSSDRNIFAAGSLSWSQYSALHEYIDHETYLHAYSNYLFLPQSSNWTDPASLARMGVRIVQKVWGYDSDQVSVKLSLAVLITYVLFVTVYLVTTLITGKTATSWDSISELVALALNSRRPENMKNTSVGIDTLETCSQLVSVRVNENHSAEIVFHDDVGARNHSYREVVPNEKY